MTEKISKNYFLFSEKNPVIFQSRKNEKLHSIFAEKDWQI
jgi:hypothetical protein